MTAPTINRNAAKKPLISGRRPDMTKPPCSPKGIIAEAEPGFFRDWLQDLACNHLINSIHSQNATSGPAGSRNHLCRFGVHLTDSG